MNSSRMRIACLVLSWHLMHAIPLVSRPATNLWLASHMTRSRGGGGIDSSDDEEYSDETSSDIDEVPVLDGGSSSDNDSFMQLFEQDVHKIVADYRAEVRQTFQKLQAEIQQAKYATKTALDEKEDESSSDTEEIQYDTYSKQAEPDSRHTVPQARAKSVYDNDIDDDDTETSSDEDDNNDDDDVIIDEDGPMYVDIFSDFPNTPDNEQDDNHERDQVQHDNDDDNDDFLVGDTDEEDDHVLDRLSVVKKPVVSDKKPVLQDKPKPEKKVVKPQKTKVDTTRTVNSTNSTKVKSKSALNKTKSTNVKADLAKTASTKPPTKVKKPDKVVDTKAKPKKKKNKPPTTQTIKITKKQVVKKNKNPKATKDDISLALLDDTSSTVVTVSASSIVLKRIKRSLSILVSSIIFYLVFTLTTRIISNSLARDVQVKNSAKL